MCRLLAWCPKLILYLAMSRYHPQLLTNWLYWPLFPILDGGMKIVNMSKMQALHVKLRVRSEELYVASSIEIDIVKIPVCRFRVWQWQEWPWVLTWLIKCRTQLQSTAYDQPCHCCNIDESVLLIINVLMTISSPLLSQSSNARGTTEKRFRSLIAVTAIKTVIALVKHKADWF